MKVLRKNIGYYEVVSLPDNYIIGTTIKDYNNGLDIVLTDAMISFKEANPTATPAEVIAMTMTVVVRTIEDAKRDKIAAIERYYNSDDINLVSIQGHDVYLCPDLRFKINERLTSEKRQGVVDTTLMLDGLSLTLSVDNAIALYDQVVLQYRAAYDAMRQHIAAVNALETIEAVDNYDGTINYPNKLVL